MLRERKAPRLKIPKLPKSVGFGFPKVDGELAMRSKASALNKSFILGGCGDLLIQNRKLTQDMAPPRSPRV